MMLISTEYLRGDRKKRKSDKLVMIVKNSDGTKERKVINSPKFTYYVTKPECYDGKPYKYIEQDKVFAVTTPFMNLFSSIQDALDDDEIRRYCRQVFNSGEDIGNKLQQIHLDYRLHNSDMNIEDFYISEFLDKYDYSKNNFGLTKMFYDIEVDSSEISGFPDQESAVCPINAISLVDLENKKIYEFLLSYEDNQSYIEFVNDLDSFKEEIINKYKEKEIEIEEVDIRIFDEEIELINDFFNTINTEKPDFASAWNNDYDFVYLFNRTLRLGYDPKEIFCPEEFPDGEKQCYYKLDNKTNKDISDRHSVYNASSYTNYVDEMAIYANITKPLGKEESYSLDYIGEKVTGMNKDEVVDNMKTFHLVNYRKFVEYNIQDSVMLGTIEKKTSHLDLLYTVGMITRTKVNNAMKKTVSLKNLARYYAMKQGYVQSNNRAKLYSKPEGKIEGAFVANPNNIDYVGVKIFDELSKFIFEIITDMDLSSLYPSIIRALNESVETLIGKVIFNEEDYNGSELIQDYISGDIINFGNKYLKLPNVDDIINLIKED